MRWMLPLTLLLLGLPSSSAWSFSEVMYDAPGSDNNAEFVELVEMTPLHEPFIPENYVFGDASSNDSLELIGNFSGNHSPSFFLFVEEGFNLSTINTNTSCLVFSLGATIGNNLGNAEDSLFFWHVDENGSTLLANASYSTSGCAAGEGCSLQFVENEWITDIPSPCVPFSTTNVTVNASTINETNCTEYDGTNCTSTSSGNVTESPSGNSSLNITNTTSTTDARCAFNFSVSISNTSVNSGDKITFKPALTTSHDDFSFGITYWFEDLHGAVYKKSVTTTNLNTKSYTPKTDEPDLVLRLVMDLALNCTNETSRLEELVIVIGDPQAASGSATGSSSTSSISSSSGSSFYFDSDKYEVLEATAPDELELNQSFSISATLYNEGLLSTTFLVWAYLYRGSVSYSGDREANLEAIVVPPGQRELATLPIQPTVTEPGDYKLKVKALKDGRKTPYEVTQTVVFVVPGDDLPILSNDNALEDVGTEEGAVLSGRSDEQKSSETIQEKEGGGDGLITGAVAAEPTTGWLLRHGAWLAVAVAGILWGLSWAVKYIKPKKPLLSPT